MAKLEEITNWLNGYLKIDEFQDNCWNGLQIEGNSEVNKVSLAVDAGFDIFTKAQKEQTDMIIVHHGHYWRGVNPTHTGWKKQRLSPLLDNGISLYAAHLPLDSHPDIGHNAMIIKRLKAEIQAGFYIRHGINIGWQGIFKEAANRGNLINQINETLNTKAKVLPFGDEVIRSIAVCSGHGGYDGFYEALNKNVDIYITGDAIDIYQTAKDAKMNVVFAGHYATETLGLTALGEILKEEFNIETAFIDEPTGL